MKTKEKVASEFAIIFTVYNLRSAISILGVKELMKRLRAASSHYLSIIWASFKWMEAIFSKPVLFPKPLFAKLGLLRPSHNSNK